MLRRTKAAAIAAFSGIYLLLGFLFWTASSPSGDARALDLFKEKRYRYAHVYVEELEKSSNDPRYALFQGYILRDNQDLTASDLRLKKALRLIEKNGSSKKLIMEVYLNQALNAYLADDVEKLGVSIKNMEGLKEPDLGWIKVFTSIQETKKNKQKREELSVYEKRALKYLSPWMEESFSLQFNAEWFEMHQIRWLIDEGKFIVARQKLDDLMDHSSDALKEEIYFLTGLTYFKEGQERSLDNAAAYYKLAFSYFDRMKEKKHLKDWQAMAASLQKKVSDLTNSNSNWGNITFYFGLLDKLTPWIDSHVLVPDLACVISEKVRLRETKQALELIHLVAKSSFREEMKSYMEAAAQVALKQKCLEKIECCNYVVQLLMNENESNPLPQYIEEEILRIALFDSGSLDQTIPLISLWSKIETNTKRRSLFAEQIVRDAERIWSIYADHEKAITLMKLAEQACHQSERMHIHQLIETAVGDIYKSAVTRDKVSQYFCVMDAVRSLQLVYVDVFNREETLHQLGDAEYYFGKHRFQEANERALWVLQVDPQNQIANRIAGLIAHTEGNFEKALLFLGKLKQLDPLTKEALEVVSGK